MNFIRIENEEIAASRALRIGFTQFWSTAKGTPREIYDQFVARTPIADGISFREAQDDPGPGWWIEPARKSAERVIFFIHGGGYGLGHARAYRGFVSQMVDRTKVSAFALEYPLAPEATLPTALDVAVSALAQLAAKYASVAVMGDSAGGGLALATVIEAQTKRIPVSSLVLFSPWTDLSLSGASAKDLAVGDPLLDPAYLRASAEAYLGSRPATDPQASPLFASDLRLPPALIQVGTDEVLLDDSRRLAEAAAKAGSEVVLEVWQGMHHVFQLNTKELASARKALDNAAKFLEEHWPN